MTAVLAPARRASRTGLVLVAAAAAWIWVLAAWRDMGIMPGTMGLGIVSFAGMWTVMMAAMMLPATAPIASMYARSLTSRHTGRMVLFTVGYLGVWATAGLPAYGLAVGAGHVADQVPGLGRLAGAGIFAANGVYQLSSWKGRCLAVCRAPFGLMLRYASWRGRTRDLRAGAHHGAFCLGCCWALMALLAAFGVMNVWAMVALTAVVVAEKATPAGHMFARVAGVASLAAAGAVFWLPGLAPGLTGGGMAAMGGMR